MRIVKGLFITVLSLIGATTIEAQETVETTIEADFVNQYIWRGQDLGNAAIQPTLGIGWKGLSLSAWGSYGLTNADDVKEFDLTASYSTGGLTIGLTDYWFSAGLDPDGRYFKYDAHGTNHLFEAFAGYDFGILSATWYTNIAGNDGMNKKGKRAYSSYLEMSAPFKLASVDWTATLGCVPWATESYGTTGFAVTNISLRATKEIRVTDTFSIPLFGELVGNPCSQRAYLVFGFTMHP